MKINIIEGQDSDRAAWFKLWVDGKHKFSIGSLSECPEDATIERDLNFVYEIVPLIRAAYDAGRNGELLEIEQENK